MPKARSEDLATFLRRQQAEDLASVLLELSETLVPLRERLEHMLRGLYSDSNLHVYRTRRTRLGWDDRKQSCC